MRNDNTIDVLNWLGGDVSITGPVRVDGIGRGIRGALIHSDGAGHVRIHAQDVTATQHGIHGLNRGFGDGIYAQPLNGGTIDVAVNDITGSGINFGLRALANPGNIRVVTKGAIAIRGEAIYLTNGYRSPTRWSRTKARECGSWTRSGLLEE